MCLPLLYEQRFQVTYESHEKQYFNPGRENEHIPVMTLIFQFDLYTD